MLRNRTIDALVMTGCALVGVVAFATPVSAAPPANDTQAGAVELAAPPSTVTQDTTDATVDAAESVAQSFCLSLGAPAFEHAVWFRTTVPAGGLSESVLIDASASDYSVGLAILQDTGSGLSALACSPGTFVAPGGGATPAGTYYIVAFGDGFLTAATSGTLVLDVSVAPPPPTLSMTIDPVGTATKDGGAWISGTVTCTGGGSAAQVVDLEGQLSQTVGRLIITSFFFDAPLIPCDGVAHAWREFVPPSNGKFAGGKAATVTFAIGCGVAECSSTFASATIKLNRART